MIAVDDVQRADEPSLALLASLALQAHQLRLLIHVTVDADEREHRPPAFQVLVEHAAVEHLTALDLAQTEALLSSVFGPVPNLAMLASRLFNVALGQPAATMELARHLVRAGTVRYEKGQWTLPSTLEPDALPASAHEALAARIASLPALARRLAEAQALVGNPMRRGDYALLAPEASMPEVDAAILTMLERAIVHGDGDQYWLSHRTLSETLSALLSPAQKAERHLALYASYQGQADSHPYYVVHHLLEAEQVDRALDLLATLSQGKVDLRDADAAVERTEPARLATRRGPPAFRGPSALARDGNRRQARACR